MSKQIRVHVCKTTRKFIQMRYVDPDTGKQVWRSTKTTTRREALKRAGAWEDELNSGRYSRMHDLSWEEFRKQYRREWLKALRPKSRKKVEGVLNVYERSMSPGRLSAISAKKLSEYQSCLREAEEAPSTISGHTAIILSAMRWAKRLGHVRAVPEMPKVPHAKASKLMKGRPINDAEFKVFLDAVPDIVGADRAPQWKRSLRGLYLSGLRIEEAVILHWDRPDVLCVDLTQRRPVFRVHAETEKSGEDRFLPMAPEFAEFLMETPKAKRAGRVFDFPPARPGRMPEGPNAEWVSKVIVKIGEVSEIVVDTKSGKTVSAHDLRRSFGARWARKVMPATLMKLMRHDDISTTMKFYAELEAQETADDLWKAHRNGRAKSPPPKARANK
jgi:integrase